MSRFRVWGVAAALVASAAPAIADDPLNTGADTRPFYKRLFSSGKPAGNPVVNSGPVATIPGQPTFSRPLPPEMVQSALQAEQDAYLRRLNVCDKLRQVALDRNDSALLRQVEELERQSEAIYKRRVGALGLSRSVRAPLPAANSGFASSFDLAPEKPSDPKTAAAKLIAPAAPVPVSGTASATSNFGDPLGSSQAVQGVREVKP